MSQYETYFRTFISVTHAIVASLDLDKVLAAVTEQVARAIGGKACTIRLLNKAGDTLMASASYGLSRQYLRKGPVEVAKSAVDKDALAGKTVYIEDVKNDSRFQYPQAAKDEGICSVLVLPLQVEGRNIGVLRVYTECKRAFNDAEKEFLTAMADLSALAIENARMHQALRTSYEHLTSFEYRMFED